MTTLGDNWFLVCLLANDAHKGDLLQHLFFLLFSAVRLNPMTVRTCNDRTAQICLALMDFFPFAV